MSPLRRYMLSVSVVGLGVLAFALWLGRLELAQPDPVAWVLALALIFVPLLVFWLRDRSSSRGAPAEQDEREAMPKAALLRGCVQ